MSQKLRDEFQTRLDDDQPSSSKRSVYKPLVHEDSIRLLEIEPGTSEQNVVCNLKYTTFGQKPSYHALSYTWGAPSPTYNILIDGQNFEIRENLYSALRRFRSSHRSEMLWIDAICLDQDDIQERNDQVQQMSRMYENAVTTFVWLGDCLETDKMILGLFQELEQEAEAATLLTPANFIGERINQPLMQESLASVLAKSWFGRAWVRQEFTNSSQVLFVCGLSQFKAATFKDVLHAFSLLGLGLGAQLWPHVMRAKGFIWLRDLQQNEGSLQALPTMLMSIWKCEATDPRDHVYSLLGLILEEDRKQIVVDYNLAVADVYARCMFNCLVTETKGEHTFVLLSGVAVFPPGASRSSLPSWVPDFSSSSGWRPIMEYTEEYRASGNATKSIYIDVDTKKAIISGIVIDTVKIITHFPWPRFVDISMAQLRDWLQTCRTTAEREGTFYLEETFEHVWWRLLVCDVYCCEGDGRLDDYLSATEGFGVYYLSPDIISRYSGEAEERSHKLMPKDTELSRMKTAFQHTMMLIALGCSFCVTSKGLLGWVHPFVEVGDKICLLAGATAPWVVRERQDGAYQLLGPAYIHGIMYGEALEWEGFEWEPLHFL